MVTYTHTLFMIELAHWFNDMAGWLVVLLHDCIEWEALKLIVVWWRAFCWWVQRALCVVAT